jgi:hypothetical protein
MLVRMWEKGKLPLVVGIEGSITLQKIIWKLLKKLKIDLSYHPAIPLLQIYPKGL